MIMTDSGFYIPRSDIAYIKGGYAYLWWTQRLSWLYV